MLYAAERAVLTVAMSTPALKSVHLAAHRRVAFSLLSDLNYTEVSASVYKPSVLA